MARIRSGEGLRPSTFEWLRGVLEPARLRPLALAGAGACAVWIAVLVVPRPDSSVTQKTAPIAQTSPAPATVTPLAGDMTALSPTASGELAAGGSATPIQTPVTRVRDDVAARPRSESRSAAPNFASASADPEWSAPSSGQDSSLPNPGDRFIDEYITDQFYLERGLGGSGNPTIAPVSGRPSDDVYIIF